VDLGRHQSPCAWSGNVDVAMTSFKSIILNFLGSSIIETLFEPLCFGEIPSFLFLAIVVPLYGYHVHLDVFKSIFTYRILIPPLSVPVQKS